MEYVGDSIITTNTEIPVVAQDGELESGDNITTLFGKVKRKLNDINELDEKISEVNESLEVGASVNKGDELGVVSTNNRTEYKDGAHLHFEVLENGVKVDPYKYLLTEEK